MQRPGRLWLLALLAGGACVVVLAVAARDRTSSAIDEAAGPATSRGTRPLATLSPPPDPRPLTRERVAAPGADAGRIELTSRRVVPREDLLPAGYDAGQLLGPDVRALPRPTRGGVRPEEVEATVRTCTGFCDWWRSRRDSGCPQEELVPSAEDGFITGRVVRSDGTVVARGAVYLSPQEPEGQLRVVGFSDGRYGARLLSGRYVAYAAMKPIGESDGIVRLSQNLVPVEIVRGEVTQLELRPNDELARVRVRLRDASGPVVGARLFADRLYDDGEIVPGSDATGALEVALLPGPHLLGAWAPGYDVTVLTVDLIPDEVADLGGVLLNRHGAP